MSRGIYFEYNDKWIFEHREVYTNWKDLCTVYNETFGTNYCYNTFKSHCNREMRLRSDIPYTEEQDKWLIENYPKLGRNKTTAEFNKQFHTNKNVSSRRIHCIRLGLKVSDERKRIRAVENTNRYHEPGTIVKKDHDYLFIKKPDGKWEQLQRFIFSNSVGCIPKDHIIVFLDGNKQNFEPRNLVAIPRKYSAIMTKNNFWSEFSEITETGIKWCELYEVLSKSDNVNIDI